MYLKATSRLISYLSSIRGTNKRPTILQRFGVGGMSFFILVSGIVLMTYAQHNYQLVVRDEHTILNAPAPFFYGGLLLTAITLLWLCLLSILHKRKIGWVIKQGNDRKNLQWEHIIIFVFIGIMCGTSGACRYINGAFDNSSKKTYQGKIIRLYTQQIGKGGTAYFVTVTDWKKPQSYVTLQIDIPSYQSLRNRDVINIKTQSGKLGYEWTADFR